MSKFKDLTGQKFNRLTVIKRGEDTWLKSGKRIVQWLCLCDCQVDVPEHQRELILVRSGNLTSGNTKSCGCLKNEQRIKTGHNNKNRRNNRRRVDRIGESRINTQGYLMTVIGYENASNIIVQFNDEYHACVKTTWEHFNNRKSVENPYHPTIYNIGRVGNKYPITISSGKRSKEYFLWKEILYRCYSEQFKESRPTYQDVICDPEWHLFENFYEWLHSQENFEKWINEEDWAIDKDILFKGNKVYSPERCCLVPKNVNCLFCKSDALRGELPIGVSFDHDSNYRARVNDPIRKQVSKLIGTYGTEDKAFLAYKNEKEKIIKEVANIEYQKGNITEQCYKAMLSYQVEITD